MLVDTGLIYSYVQVQISQLTFLLTWHRQSKALNSPSLCSLSPPPPPPPPYSLFKPLYLYKLALLQPFPLKPEMTMYFSCFGCNCDNKWVFNFHWYLFVFFCYFTTYHSLSLGSLLVFFISYYWFDLDSRFAEFQVGCSYS